MAAPPAAQSKGSGLTRKAGPLPVWAWALIGAVVLYFLYKALSGTTVGSSGAAVQAAQTPSQTTPQTSMGDVGSGSTSGTDQSTSDLVSSLGGEQANLFSAIEAANQDVLGLASSQISYLQSQTALSSNTSETQPTIGAQPGGANAPVIQYVSPQAVAPTASQPVTAQVAAKSSAATSNAGGPFGGVTKVTKLNSGATLTTYASGRQVEQAPGKSPYVVKQ